MNADRAGTAWPAIRDADPSPALRIETGSSAAIRSRIRELGPDIEHGRVRYYLRAGSRRFGRAPWQRPVPPAAPRAWTALSIVDRILSAREEHAVVLDRELRVIRSWLATPDDRARLVLVETFGELDYNTVEFLQACRRELAVGSAPESALLVLRHEPSGVGPVVAGAPDRQADEILLAFWLAGGVAGADPVERWTAARGWDAALVDALTSGRETGAARTVTWATSGERARAAAAFRSAGRRRLADLAALVAAGESEPALATAALVDDPRTALAAFSVAGVAEGASSPGVLSGYGRNLYRAARADGWSRVGEGFAAAVQSATLVADRRRVSPAAAGALLRRAERRSVDPEVRSLLAYGLGQLLAKDADPAVRSAAEGCFDYARSCGSAAADPNPDAAGSRAAASFNGAALARYRAGDHAGAAELEEEALRALHRPGVLDGGHLGEQHILVLANLGKVHARTPGGRDEALVRFRRAWTVALAGDSLPGLAYVAADLTRALLAGDEHAAAEAVVRTLLDRYDAAPDPARDVERGLLAACWLLADANLARGATGAAAQWYVAAVRRMHRPTPAVIAGIIRNLRGQPVEPPAPTMRLLERLLAAHTRTVRDLRVLRELLPADLSTRTGDDD